MNLVLLLVLVVGVYCQDDPLGKAIQEVFPQPTPEDDFLSQFGAVVTKKPLESISAQDKCGEGSDAGKNACVPYYNCDGKTRTIIQNGQTDGFGIIDIRNGQNACDHYLDVCCKIPETGIPPDVTTQKPVVNPKEPTVTSTIPPITPGRGNFCGIRNVNGIDFKITGNKDGEAEYGEFPWMLAILKKNYDPKVDEAFAICGAALITPVVAITGAHCVQKYKTNELIVRAGEWDAQTTRERIPYQEREVEDIIIHKDFHAQTLYNNVALIVLKQPYVKADNLGTICLPPPGVQFNERNCFTSGWGKDKFGQKGQYQVILKKIKLPTVPFGQCQEALRKTRLGSYFKLHETFICAGGETGKDACTGDGGSPLICPDPSNPGRYYQAGIVSWGVGCGEEGIPGVYADVAKFRNWVDEEMKRQSLDTKPYEI